MMKKSLRGLCVLLLGLGAMVQTPLALAQVPPHKPGTICFTERFWCWARKPGTPGQRCSCPSPYGNVPGRLG